MLTELQKEGPIPVVEYPRAYVEKIKSEIDALKAQPSESYDSVSGLLDALEK